jgi:hypothetical protein
MGRRHDAAQVRVWLLRGGVVKPAPVGTRVVVNTGHWNGQGGVIMPARPALLNGHDCLVMLDSHARYISLASARDLSLCFYWHELAVWS